ncbi:MAG: nodulation protein NfeD [Pseudomonadota bacterium]
MKLRKYKKYFYLIPFCLAFFSFLIGASSQSEQKVYIATLDDQIINPVMVDYIDKAIAEAKANQAQCLILKLDTPGGLLTSTRKIVKSIMNSEVPVVVYVAPQGARAGSAGVFITLAANIAAMAPSTNIGAAHPVNLQEDKGSKDNLEDLLQRLVDKKPDQKQDQESASPMQDKILNDTTAWVKGIAQTRGRNVNWAIKAVTESVSVEEQEALKLNIINFIAKDVADLLTKIDGQKITIGDQNKILNTKNAAQIQIEPGLRVKILATLAHPNIAYILLMLGFYGLLFEFTNPGIGFSGIAGVICLVLAFFGLQILPTNYAGIVLIALAIILFIVEIKVISYGLLTLGGLVSFLVGSLILFDTPHKFMQVSLPLVGGFAAATFIVAAFLAFIAIRSHQRKSKIGLEGLIGEVAEVSKARGKKGKVFVHGEIWDVISENNLEVGKPVEVIGKQATKLIVK